MRLSSQSLQFHPSIGWNIGWMDADCIDDATMLTANCALDYGMLTGGPFVGHSGGFLAKGATPGLTGMLSTCGGMLLRMIGLRDWVLLPRTARAIGG
jgi:hypothetical protein